MSSPLKVVLSDFSKIEGVRAVGVVSKDGFIIDAVVPAGGIDTEALAAMLISIYGASERIGEEFRMGDIDIISIEYRNNILLITDLGEALFSVVADKTAVLGRLRFEIKRQRERIKMAL